VETTTVTTTSTTKSNALNIFGHRSQMQYKYPLNPNFVSLRCFVGSTGNASCDCLPTGTFDDEMENSGPQSGTLRVNVGGEQFYYPPNYGLGACYAHDYNLQPLCAVAIAGATQSYPQTGLPLPSAQQPDWCASQWCYVDQLNCKKDFHPKASYYLPGNYYSYETCGHADTFALSESNYCIVVT